MQKTPKNAKNGKKANVYRPTDQLSNIAGHRVASMQLKTKDVNIFVTISNSHYYFS